MDDEQNTPVAALETAVNAYMEATEPGAMLGGAVIAFELSRVDEDGDLIFETNYVLLNDRTSPALAEGVTRRALRSIIEDTSEWDIVVDDDTDDE